MCRRKRTAGTVLISVGASFVVLALVGSMVDFANNKLDWTEVGLEFGFGLAGTAMTLGGIPLLVTGSIDQERARSLRQGSP
jgi:hypothetical protein